MIIGIAGKKQSGKDTVAKIIQYLIYKDEHINDANFHYPIDEWWKEVINNNITDSIPLVTKDNWVTVKFADKLKDIVCLLIGCTREDLEDEEFKNKQLPPKWWTYGYKDHNSMHFNLVPYIGNNIEDLHRGWLQVITFKPTPRTMLQDIGTNLFRNNIHPDIWVNATMSNYKGKDVYEGNMYIDRGIYPNWIIPDVRFPNEVKAIEKDGFIIKVVRPNNETNDKHTSETALDNVEFEYTILNDSGIEKLVENVKQILIKENIL